MRIDINSCVSMSTNAKWSSNKVLNRALNIPLKEVTYFRMPLNFLVFEALDLTTVNCNY